MARSVLKTISATLVFSSALALSVLAAFISIVGMTALFPADGITIAIMMAILEASKLVTAGWLHANWHNKAVSFLHKTYLCLAVIALMIITAIGIYGYLSKGYLEQKTPLGTIELQIGQKQQQIDTDTINIKRLNARQEQLDASVNALIAQNQIARSQTLRTQQKKEREQVITDLSAAQHDVEKLTAELVPLKMSTNDVEAKLGPIKYVAELFGMTKPDVAVRMVILILMFAFDPLAVVLILSGAITLGDMARKPVEMKEDDTYDPMKVVEQAFVDHDRWQQTGQPTPKKLNTAINLTVIPIDGEADKQTILEILQRNPDTIEEIIDTVIEWHEHHPHQNKL